MNPELDRKLRSLRLSGMAAAVDARNQEAIHHNLTFTDFLELLVEMLLNLTRSVAGNKWTPRFFAIVATIFFRHSCFTCGTATPLPNPVLPWFSRAIADRATVSTDSGGIAP